MENPPQHREVPVDRRNLDFVALAMRDKGGDDLGCNTIDRKS